MSVTKLFARLKISDSLNFLPGQITKTAGLHVPNVPPKYDIEYPERKKLRIYDKVPQYPPSMKPFKMQKRLRYMRGEEETHNFLLHRQYGVVAQIGGRLKYGHFEMIRFVMGKKLPSSCFAVYRVDPPWQPVTKKGQGMRMGGGKGAIDHYVTPIKAGRVIVEVGGPVEFLEVKKALDEVAHKLPFKAIAVSQEAMDTMAALEKKNEEENLNPWTFKYIVQNNIGGCGRWISPVDKKWFGKHR